ncbi:MAG TPA: NTP transferase domain-containing protein, partial [Candidatus Atribacteria bacterium]|nr:NTP transferase domain-containing protein [Candidatus Atribacteria bacterium]
MDLSRWGLIVLAAGEGKRMRSSIPKVLLPAWGKPIIQYLLEEIEWKEFGQRFLVVSPSMEDLMQNNFGQEMTIVVQREPKGTAHAASTVFPLIQEGIDWFLVLYADMPLLRGETIFSFLSQAEGKHSPLSFLTSIAPRPAGFGRVVRDEKGEPLGIVEEKDCS